jgi:PadR family transcriptional regulator PadR
MLKLSRVTAATVDVLRALLDQPGPTWGLVIIKTTGRSPGTVYPILERLEEAGWVTSSWDDDASRPGPRRRIYALSEEGAQSATSVCKAFDAARQAGPRGRVALAGGLG